MAPSLSFLPIKRWFLQRLLSVLQSRNAERKGMALVKLFDVITSLVSLDYWGYDCEKVTSLRKATLERSGVTSLRDISIVGVT
jgi:hypothetical protein